MFIKEALGKTPFDWNANWQGGVVREKILAAFEGKNILQDFVDYLWRSNQALVEKRDVINDLWQGVLSSGRGRDPLGPYVSRARELLPSGVSLYTRSNWNQLLLRPKIETPTILLPQLAEKISDYPAAILPLAEWLWTVKVNNSELISRGGPEELKAIDVLAQAFSSGLSHRQLASSLGFNLFNDETARINLPIVCRSNSLLKKYPGPEKFVIANRRGYGYSLQRLE